MRILYIFGFFSLGGIEAVLHNRKSALEGVGLQVDILFRSTRVRGIFDGDPSVHCSRDPKRLGELLKLRDYDIVSTINSPNVIAELNKLGFDKSVINECHDSNRSFLNYIREINTSSQVKAIISPSQYWSKWIQAEYNCEIPIYYVPNGVDLTKFRLVDVQYKTHPRLWGDSKPIVCWVGRMDKAKDPLKFLTIVAKLRNVTSNFTAWMIVGSRYSRLKAEVTKVINGCNLGAHLRLVEDVPYSAMPSVYSQVARSGGCLVSTSQRECSPMAFIEAMACECPVVGGKLDETAETLQNNLTGLNYNLADTGEAVERVIDVLTKPNLRSAIVDNAYKQVYTVNNIQHTAVKLKSIYEQIILASI